MSRASHLLHRLLEAETKGSSISKNPHLRARVTDVWATKGIHPRTTRLKAFPSPMKKKQKDRLKQTDRVQNLYAKNARLRKKTKDIYKGG